MNNATNCLISLFIYVQTYLSSLIKDDEEEEEIICRQRMMEWLYPKVGQQDYYGGQQRDNANKRAVYSSLATGCRDVKRETNNKACTHGPAWRTKKKRTAANI